jgi:hypothetical protein
MPHPLPRGAFLWEMKKVAAAGGRDAVTFNLFQSISKVLFETIFFIFCGRKTMQGEVALREDLYDLRISVVKMRNTNRDH